MDKKRATKGTGTVYQLADGRWRARVVINGKSVTKEARTEKEARAFLKEVRKAHESGKTNFDKMTYSELLERWLDFKSRGNIKRQSFERLENTVRTHIEPLIGFYDIQNITSETIEKELIEKVRNKRTLEKLSYSSMKKIYDALNESFKYAVAERILANSPMFRVREPKKEAVKNSLKITTLTDEEVRRFKSACYKTYKNGKRVYPVSGIFIFMLNTGCRLGEALAVTYADYDEENQLVTIDSTITYQKDLSGVKRAVEQQSTKTKGSNRVLPLNEAAVNAIAEAKDLKQSVNPSDYIFSGSTGNPLTIKVVFNMLNDIYAEAEISAKGTHILRHTYASKLFERGIDIKYISELLGHASIKTTADIYIHLLNTSNSKLKTAVAGIF